MNAKLTRALNLLVSRVDYGTEYPDAHSRVMREFRLSPAQGVTLTAMYDARCAEHGGML